MRNNRNKKKGMRIDIFANKILSRIISILMAIIITMLIMSIITNMAIAQNGVLDLLRGSGASVPAAGQDPIQGTGRLIDLYNRYQSLIDFFVMFTLFATVALVGLNKVGFGEQGNAMKGMAIAVGAALALAALKAGYSPSFFVPFVKNFLFLIIFLVIFLVIKAVIGGENATGGTIFIAFVLALIITWVAFNVSNLVIEGEANKFNLANGLSWILSSTPTDTQEDRILSDSELGRLDATIKEKKDEKKRIEEAYFGGEELSASQIETKLKVENDKEIKTYLKRLAALMEEIKELETRKEKADAKRRAIDKKAEEEAARRAKPKPAEAAPEVPAVPTTPTPTTESAKPTPSPEPATSGSGGTPQPSTLPADLNDALNPDRAAPSKTPSTAPSTPRSRPNNSPDDL